MTVRAVHAPAPARDVVTVGDDLRAAFHVAEHLEGAAQVAVLAGAVARLGAR